MAGASLLTLLDDIAAILDDVALMSKVAARKTAGVLGDDLALNAQQVSGVNADRELPVVWAVAKGSLRNKCILVPAALLISAFIPWAVTPLLMLGGLFLCYEGFEKLYHSVTQDKAADQDDLEQELSQVGGDLKAYETNKIKGAIRTDFVLSAEIIAITLGVVSDSSFMTQVVTLSIIALVMTIGVYGLVAGIVKLDDAGLYLSRRQGEGVLTRIGRWFGGGLVNAAPYLMRGLTVVGTIAMFMVGGGILTHGLHMISHQFEYWASLVAQWQVVGPLLSMLTPSVLNSLFGVLAGAITLLVISGVSKLRQ
ncbi:DUF808 domain-containing protein [Shewanella sp. Isolate11]|uniref:DUF808 domain-containing protein n=1 Tax=Shewanella sp. Isolate11 TaxID=2908530 RepID=UPI001EFD608F|nr:DUF808 domain-containing protein [Shewanella sp. Isolate11]MCG9695773.1 DUF808 domain-containing protein [Shewanella sp. Isolate11]